MPSRADLLAARARRQRDEIERRRELLCEISRRLTAGETHDAIVAALGCEPSALMTCHLLRQAGARL